MIIKKVSLIFQSSKSSTFRFNIKDKFYLIQTIMMVIQLNMVDIFIKYVIVMLRMHHFGIDDFL